MDPDAAKLLIGRVAGRAMLQEIGAPASGNGFAKLVLHQLAADDMLAIAQAVQADPILRAKVEIALPRHYFPASGGLPDAAFTDEPITKLRNLKCAKEARLMALVDDSQAQSLANVSKISRDSLLRRELAPVWVEGAMAIAAASLPEENVRVLEVALAGLFSTDRASLRACASYLLESVTLAKTIGARKALGNALWCLRAPNLADAFATLKHLRASEFSKAFLKQFKNDCFLYKRALNQSPFTRQVLDEMFDATKEKLIEPVRSAIRHFVDSDDGWTPASEELAKLDWSEVRKFFEDAPKAKGQSLGEKTKRLFVLLDPDRFDPEDWTYVDELIARGPNAQRTDEDIAFYHKRLLEIQPEPSLTAAWERFVYGGEQNCEDFRAGLVECAHRLRRERATIKGPVVLEVLAIENEKHRLTKKNHHACRFFEARYRHLEESLADIVRFRKCEIFRYAQLDPVTREKTKSRAAAGKKANQLGFRVRLASKTREEEVSGEIRLVWEFKPQSVQNGYAGDLERLVNYAAQRKMAPLVASVVELSPKGARGGEHVFSLAEMSAIQYPKRTEQGAMVPLQKPVSLVDDWKRALNDVIARKFINPAKGESLAKIFQDFCTSYTAAVEALKKSKLSDSSIDLQAARWSSLLELICAEVQAESPCVQLLRPLLRIGIAFVRDPEQNISSALVCPWNPLRMQSMAGAEVRTVGYLRRLVLEDEAEFSDVSGDLFLKDVRQDMSSSGLPEVALIWRGEDSELLSISDELGDYSLLEPPTSSARAVSTTNENPTRTAAQISEIVKSYLALQPHERDNLSIVLYNCDSKALPPAVVESISASDDDSPTDTTCQIVLTHQDRTILGGLYESIAAQDSDDDAFYVSEASKDFMSRVRINISVDQGVPPTNGDDKATDIVFCQDVISRHADFAREPASRRYTIYPSGLMLHRWGRKRQLVAGNNSSVVYLTCPAQTHAGWNYLHALGIIASRDYAVRSWQDNDCLVPARRLNFDKAETARIFRETHALGNWVVNFDELLDRRILRHREIKVIRYRQASVGMRNLVISSKSKDTLLKATLQQKLSPLIPATVDPALHPGIVQLMIDAANEISGNLVLRAARRGANANELIGLVLSRHLVRTEFPPDQSMFCFLLDDYAEWLGQTAERVADLLILVPVDAPDGKRLDIVVTEAKFVRFDQAPAAAKESGRQLRDSLNLLTRAFFLKNSCVDQGLWLDRISDLLLEGIQDLGKNLDVAEWRSAIRDRRFKLCVRGQSHVFIHAPAEMDDEGGKFTGIKDSTGEQEVFTRRQVQMIVGSLLAHDLEKEVVKMRTALSGMPAYRRSYQAVSSPLELEERPAVKDGSDHPPPEPPPSNDTPPPSAPMPPGQPPSPATPSAPPPPPAARNEPTPSLAGPAQLLPPILQTLQTDADPADAAWLEETALRVRHAFLKRELSAEVIKMQGTPNALLMQFKGSNNLTVNLLESKLGELRTTDGLDIISVRPGLGSVIVMVARPTRKVLHLAEAWRRWRPDMARGNTKILIAVRESDNEPMYLSPYPQPHTLVAGTTGSGKSVLIQNIILGIAATNTPEQAEVVIVDPKQGLDYMGFEKLPHLIRELVTDPDEALATFGELVTEMETRLRIFKENRVQNIDDYLKKDVGSMPRLWVIHDEFGDWMQNKEYSDKVTSLVNRLGQMARAAGIYMIFAAQRPDNTIFPMILRSNLGNRLILKVDSVGTSDIATGVKGSGAEKLLGRGHLLALTGGSSEPTFAQVPFLEGIEVEQIVDQINQKYPR